jgi:hypothetical protein
MHRACRLDPVTTASTALIAAPAARAAATYVPGLKEVSLKSDFVSPRASLPTVRCRTGVKGMGADAFATAADSDCTTSMYCSL